MPYVKVGEENSSSIDLYYEDHGAGKPVVLIHGWPLSGRSWEKQVPALLDSGYRVITYDRRGFGESSRPTQGYDYDTFANDLHQLMTKLDLRDVALVGFSMGGGEVARYLSTHGSDRVSKACFMAAVPPFLLKTPDNSEGVDPGVFEGLSNGVIADRPALLASFLSDFFNVDVLEEERISEEALHFNWNIASGASPFGTLECIAAFSETDFRNDLSRIEVPTLILHGDSDRICPLAVTGARTQKAVKGSRLVVVEGAPHGFNWTHAERVNTELLGFLEKAADRSRRAGCAQAESLRSASEKDLPSGSTTR